MKKLLTAIAVLGVATLAFGQGQVNFANGATTLVSVANGVENGPLAPGPTGAALGAFNYGLFVAPTGTTDPAAFTFVSYGTNTTALGRFSGGLGTGGAPSIADNAVGTSVNVLFRGWSANFGQIAVSGTTRYDAAAQWTAVSAAVKSIVGGRASVGPTPGFYYGQSGIGTVKLGGGTTPISTPFGTTAGLISTGFALTYIPVPEPSTLALAGLGAASLLIFRRRK